MKSYLVLYLSPVGLGTAVRCGMSRRSVEVKSKEGESNAQLMLFNPGFGLYRLD